MDRGRIHSQRFKDFINVLSPGGWIICLIAIVSSLGVFLWEIEESQGLLFWTFARNHKLMYDPMTDAWNRKHEGFDSNVNILLLSAGALQRRLLSGFLSDTPLPDLVEVQAAIASQAFKGPIENIGFTDLTDRLSDEGLYEKINPASFGPWTSRGRIFGLPHDVHPVLLGYRADIVEAAGIDMSSIDTWDDFMSELQHLVADHDKDGYVDHYLLNIWVTNPDLLEMLILQAGGSFFDDDGNPCMASTINAHVLATVVSWTTGPERIAVNAPEFDAVGNKMRIDGFVLCSFVPDWLTGVWKEDLPQISGKMKLMPLPAWKPGGRRTSVMGGTMLGIPKQTENFDKAWTFAKQLYMDKDLAIELYQKSGIVTPVKEYWNDPAYDQPDPFFRSQAPGRLYIDQAPHVPRRSSSPYQALAKSKLGDAAMALKAYADEHKKYDVQSLIPEAQRLLSLEEATVRKQIDRNVFLRKDGS